MLRTLAVLVVICAVASPAAAQPHKRGWGWGHGSRDHSWSRPWYRPNQGRDAGGAFWGGVIGGTIGSWIFRQQAERPDREELDVEGEMEPWTREWIAYCERRYRTFDIRDGRYTSYDGNRYFCK